MRSASSWVTTHSLSGFGKLRRRPVFGSRRVSVRFQTQWPMYFSFASMRVIVDGDQPFVIRYRPGDVLAR